MLPLLYYGGMLKSCSALLVVLGGLQGAAYADQQQDAEAFEVLARSAHEQEKYLECAVYFRKSYSIAKTTNLLFNTALCHEKAGELQKALGAFEEYLRIAPKGERASESGTRAQLLKFKLNEAKSAVGPVRRPMPEEGASEKPNPSVPAPVSDAPHAPAPQPGASNAAKTAANILRLRAAKAAPYAGLVGQVGLAPTATGNYRRAGGTGGAYLVLNGGVVSLGGNGGGGSGASLDLRGHIGNETLSFMMGVPVSVGALGPDDDSSLYLATGIDIGFLVGSSKIGFFAAPGVGMIVHSPTNESGLGFDLRVSTGLALSVTNNFELRSLYKRHILDEINVYGLSLGYRFLPK